MKKTRKNTVKMIFIFGWFLTKHGKIKERGKNTGDRIPEAGKKVGQTIPFTNHQVALYPQNIVFLLIKNKRQSVPIPHVQISTICMLSVH